MRKEKVVLSSNGRKATVTILQRLRDAAGRLLGGFKKVIVSGQVVRDEDGDIVAVQITPRTLAPRRGESPIGVSLENPIVVAERLITLDLLNADPRPPILCDEHGNPLPKEEVARQSEQREGRRLARSLNDALAEPGEESTYAPRHPAGMERREMLGIARHFNSKRMISISSSSAENPAPKKKTSPKPRLVGVQDPEGGLISSQEDFDRIMANATPPEGESRVVEVTPQLRKLLLGHLGQFTNLHRVQETEFYNKEIRGISVYGEILYLQREIPLAKEALKKATSEKAYFSSATADEFHRKIDSATGHLRRLLETAVDVGMDPGRLKVNPETGRPWPQMEMEYVYTPLTPKEKLNKLLSVKTESVEGRRRSQPIKAGWVSISAHGQITPLFPEDGKRGGVTELLDTLKEERESKKKKTPTPPTEDQE